MNAITWIHIAGGLVALASGAVAIAARKGGATHESVGTWFCIAMFVLGATASMLAPFKSPPETPIGGMMVCYFVATAWMAARRRSGVPGTFEKIACALGLALAALIIGGGVELVLSPGQAAGPPGPMGLFVLGAICLAGGMGDLRFLLRKQLSRAQRLSRHLWRMCFAFFIATGSFFLGQQDVLPQAVRGSSLLLVLAFAPFAVMVCWFVRVRLSRSFATASPALPLEE